MHRLFSSLFVLKLAILCYSVQGPAETSTSHSPMCLFSIIYQVDPHFPVFVLANREEALERPSAAPEIVSPPAKNMNWLGGRDLLAGGTWLGVNAGGLVVAVTNRAKTPRPGKLKSRGLLCRELLEQPSLVAAEREFQRQWQRENFAGLNLLMISRERGVIVSAGDRIHLQPLERGRHAIANGDWNDPEDRRIARVQKAMEAFPADDPTGREWIERAEALCGAGEEQGGDAICLPFRSGWGTVSSSIIALSHDPAKCRYLHAAGPPSDTHYRDYSPLLVSLFTSN